MRAGQLKVTQSLLAGVFDHSVRVVDVVGLGGDWAPVRRLRLDNDATVVVKTVREKVGPWGGSDAVLQNEHSRWARNSRVDQAACQPPVEQSA